LRELLIKFQQNLLEKLALLLSIHIQNLEAVAPTVHGIFKKKQIFPQINYKLLAQFLPLSLFLLENKQDQDTTWYGG